MNCRHTQGRPATRGLPLGYSTSRGNLDLNLVRELRVKSAIRRLVFGLILVVLIDSGARANGPGPGYDIDMNRMIPMRDGAQLEAWITKPSSPASKLPTVLTLTQYDIDGGRHGDEAGYYAERGYAFVQAYVRGRGNSGGVKSDNLGSQVGRDGYDLVEWIAAQPWSDGRVVMFGGSFVGMTQWRTATQLPPHLSAIAPYVPIYPGWDVPNSNGIPQAWTTVILGYTAGRSLNNGFIRNQAYWAGKMLEQYAAYRPFYELDRAIGIAPNDWSMPDAQGNANSMFDVWLDHLGDATFNLSAEPKPSDYQQMKFPVLTATGYYDDDQPGALRYYRNFVAHASAASVAQLYLVIGPWDHSGTQEPTKMIEGLAIPPVAVWICRSCMPIGTISRCIEDPCQHCCAIMLRTSCSARTSGDMRTPSRRHHPARN